MVQRHADAHQQGGVQVGACKYFVGIAAVAAYLLCQPRDGVALAFQFKGYHLPDVWCVIVHKNKVGCVLVE